MPRVTITEVARAAGVSVATASKALNHTGSISADTISRITQAADRLGYRPNRAAQLLAGKNKKIGILIPEFPEEVVSLYRRGLEEAMASYEEYGFQHKLVSYKHDYDRKSFPQALEQLCGECNGLIFMSGYRESMYHRELEQVDIPKISLHSMVDPSLCPTVSIDAVGVGRMAADFLSLCMRGKKAAVIAGAHAGVHRYNIEGFRSAAAERGLEILAIEECYDSLERAYTVTEQILSQGEPDGIFVSTYAAPAVCDCLKAHGKAGQIRVIGVDIYRESAACLTDGSLTACICQNQPLQAKLAVEMLISVLRGERRPTESRFVKPELVLRSNLRHYTTDIIQDE